MHRVIFGSLPATLALGLLAVSPHVHAVEGRYQQLPNFDAHAVSEAAALAARRAGVVGQVSRFGYRSEVDEDTGTAFVWAGKERRLAAAAAAVVPHGRAGWDARARQHLRGMARDLGLSAKGIQEAELHDLHDRGNGPVIARYRQRVNGLEVFGRELNVMSDRQGRLVAISGLFSSDAASATSRAAQFSWSAERAVASAFADAGGQGLAALAGGKAESGYLVFQRATAAGDLQWRKDPRARKVLYPVAGQLVPAYYVEVSVGSAPDRFQMDYGYVISAIDGSVLMRKDQRADEAFTYRMFAAKDATGFPYDEPLGNNFAPFTGETFDAPITRSVVKSRLVTLANSSLLSTGDPWLPAGATTTSGNNVDAYLDLAAPDGFTAGVDLRPSTTAPNTFDYPLAGDVDPSTPAAQSAAVVNLFYMNNFLHDFWYDRGFDEAAGNAQQDNYGRGGKAGDPIHAEGQDYSGRNNANMSTPADGRSPTMQMYLFDGLPKGKYAVLSPAALKGTLTYSTAGFGPRAFDLTGQLVLVDDGTAPTSDGCTAPVNAAALVGKIALIDRGTCDFVLKVKLAQAAGAVGATIVNNTTGAPISMGGTDATITIPSMMITQEDGANLKASTKPVKVRMQRIATPDLDGTLDEGVISHEFFHYVSNRLVGNGSGLINNQGGGMGEGWSDFSTLLMQVRAEDRQVPGNADFSGAYPVGTYVGADYYFGIRRAPYSTDMAKNPLTFKHIQNGEPLPTTAPLAFGQDGASNAEVHSTGEIWCNTLWEAYAGFLNDGRYTFEQARTKVQEYIISGLKMTPSRPTLLQARDAILSAADASDDQDFQIWANAFAKRGMGLGAKGPGSLSTNNKGVTESYTPASPSL